MTVKELIDFYFRIRQSANLIGFDELYAPELDRLKEAVKAHYGNQEAWLDLSEEEEVPTAIAERIEKLKRLFRAWESG